jgi:GDP-L-fucose synthase
MQRDSRIYVAGHRGLAGSAIVRALRAAGFENLLLRTSSELDLAEQAPVRRFFETERPEYVFDAAAKVGGIHANASLPAEFVRINLAIQTNLIHEAWRAGVKRLLFLGSNCVYPRDCPQPMKEEHLLSGPLEYTNRPYAIAKIAGVEMCWAYNRQHGTRFASPVPASLFGPNDNYDPDRSHVTAALIRRFHEAKAGRAASVMLWGSGAPRRELLYSDDMAAACLCLMELSDADFDRIYDSGCAAPQPPLINIGWGEDYTIHELAERVRDVVGYKGALEWDPGKPDGTPRKLLDISRMKALGWSPRIALEEGLRRAYADFLSRYG